MESDSHPPSASSHASDWFANFVGTVIALMTLTLPLLTIAHYSPSQGATWQSPPYPIQGLTNNQP
ncbi:hypothetical protein M595_4147 [Lyngbya aestuarii BL J]|uniref:Uncharacterized protein n=1 Tax=Lyngbya aestuarii BL J TaxID=1348334 RepID=U7QDK1_9CYAN|nr:hypothetical protein [Lyngbya aestuarii]ERT05898.1 hypothetical protein M595_4147 [Lyngbya aestuarii BL J]